MAFVVLAEVGIQQSDNRHVLPEGWRYTGYLLGKHPSADAAMPSRKGELKQLACTPFYIFLRSAVVEGYERVGALEKKAHQLQPNIYLVLHAYYHNHPRIVFINSGGGRSCCARKSEGQMSTMKSNLPRKGP